MQLDSIQAGKIRADATYVVVADAIRRWIALGMLAPGDRLPTERELAERLSVGRMTVRQAIRVLAEEGLVGTQRGRSGGSFILDDADRPVRAEALTEQYLADVRDNFDFRLGVEPMAARLAAQRAEPEQRVLIGELAQGKPATYRAFRMRDSRFHIAIAEACHNQLLLEAVSQSRAEFFRWADAAWERVDWGTLSERERDFELSHRGIADAVRAGAPVEAEERMTEHLIAGKAQFLAAVESAQTERSPAG